MIEEPRSSAQNSIMIEENQDFRYSSTMVELVRQSYLSKLLPLAQEPELVKVLTGVRRGGKSVLMRQIAAQVGRTVPPERITSVNFELASTQEIANAEDLLRHLNHQTSGHEGLHYVFLDEVQEVAGFEKAINSLRAQGNVSLFITGSNQHLLSGELATYLAGRYLETRVWPLSYAESIELQTQSGLPSGGLANYLRWGGMPFRFRLEGDTRQAYLRDVFNSVVLRDVVQREGIRDIAALESILDFTVENLGRVMSPSSISAYLKSQGRSLSADSIYSYLRALDSAMLLNRVRRYDLRGKKVLSTLDKYYATDLGLLTAKRVGQGPGPGDVLENAVYAELARRGYDIYTGHSDIGEVDFVAVKDGMPRYVQVAYLLGSDDVVSREYGAFGSIKDNHPKYVVSLDPITHSRDGIRHLNAEEFLLDPPSDLA